MKDKSVERKLLSDLKARRIDGMLTSEIADRYGISVSVAYRFMLKQVELGFESESGARLARNSGTEDSGIRHTHWFFT